MSITFSNRTLSSRHFSIRTDTVDTMPVRQQASDIYFSHRNVGVTLTELLVALSIVSILVALTMPNLGRYWQGQQSDVYIANLQRAIATTRSTAISSREITSLCPYAEGGCGNDWQLGMIIFIDKNNDGIIDENETLLEKIIFTPNNSSVRWRASGGKNYLRYSPSGVARQFGRFYLCDNNGDLTLARALVINRQGRVRVYRDRNTDGIVEDIDGRMPDCPG